MTKLGEVRCNIADKVGYRTDAFSKQDQAKSSPTKAALRRAGD